MTVFAVEGPAGSGKTHRLVRALEEELAVHPIPDSARILALTFMHGAKSRLEERLSRLRPVQGRVDCMTVDSFAWKLRRRWRSLCLQMGQPDGFDGDFDAECAASGALLERESVSRWIATSFPIVVIDEGQDLKPQRLRMVSALAAKTRVLIAADEFQCLDQDLRPNPLVQWLPTVCEPEILVNVHRTNVAPLLEAARTIRQGNAPRQRGAFRLFPAVSIPMAAAGLASAIAWNSGRQIAVITPSIRGDFARNVVFRVSSMACGRRQLGPYPIVWEKSSAEEVAAVASILPQQEVILAEVARQALSRLPQGAVSRGMTGWLDAQLFEFGRREFTREELLERAKRVIDMRRALGGRSGRISAMTVAQAKNREFEGVVVLWPYQVGGDDEQKRRLLYNAITRAKSWCTVIVQGQALPNRAPFV